MPLWRCELHTLSQRQVAAVVQRTGLPPHVGLPGIAAGLAAAAGFLLAAERAADLGAAGADVDVGNAAVAASRREERLGILKTVGENRARQPLRHGVVQRDGLVERLIREDIQN